MSPLAQAWIPCFPQPSARLRGADARVPEADQAELGLQFTCIRMASVIVSCVPTAGSRSHGSGPQAVAHWEQPLWQRLRVEVEALKGK
jgi:hypothetical protein